MDFEYLRLISFDELESGKLSSISPDTFEMASDYLSELYEEAKSIDHFMTKRGSELIDEIESVQSVLQTIIDQRFKKIIRLAENQVGSGKVDKAELKMLLPAEQEMFDEILCAIGKCRDKLAGAYRENELSKTASSKKAKISPAVQREMPPDVSSRFITGSPDLPCETCEDYPVEPAETGDENPDEEELIGYDIVYLKESIDPFMGLDGHIYSLSAEDIVTLPSRNASVLCGRNIALNIRVGK
ncbi:DNA replication factor GINS [Methanomicrobium sp. W14]|uniref:DNA replication complex GINS family protein n=1 Tax=Methanomicrobium sp. W14 TaxID=2817839 RepID=UPI001AE18EFD|nr:DNA replication complex GINS family protein [Methanomicrobium sp. W14]MBP2132769.1 DNA replication factor GINS [Methanomicrobium sp. W14]